MLANIPDLTRSPEGLALAPSKRSKFDSFITGFNAELSQQAADFRVSHPDLRLFEFDARTVADAMLDNPSAYGLRNVTGYCPSYREYRYNKDWNTQFDPKCGEPVNKYFWVSSSHPTSTVHNEWGRKLAEILQHAA